MVNNKPRFLREVIKEELSQLKRADLDKDEQPLKLISKEIMKENIGRSPDFLDTLIMRMYWEVRQRMHSTTINKSQRNEKKSIEEQSAEILNKLPKSNIVLTQIE